ncbi:unnamed protein product [Paramecium sonneborni]|uniref:Uncharacterized protein n=1 Tax=Paramecium sonneborni TaxID=65129 RepID=A0A8S1RVV8_9CILI|nr:unnamed protein product [Paramecium sonneborni]
MMMNFLNGYIRDCYFLQLQRIYQLQLKLFNIGVQKDSILDSGIPMVNQILIVMAGIQLRINPKMVDDIIRLIYDKEDKQKLLEQLQQAEQKQVSLKVTNSPKILKAKVEQKDPGLFGNILTALRCWDKKQK